ncbi:M20 family metallopeptidase [Paenibacillus sp. MBLB4367]|uniref:M20 family metallopeptidase n=1 Tax=Paenibacillus sp. MBLB4367 TaxID=3384767 RepID=UPI003908049A
MMEQRSKLIKEWVERHRDEAVDLARKLVQIYSVNLPPNGSEAEHQQFVADWMKEAGAEIDKYELSEVPGLTEHPAYMKGRHYEGRPNVLGTFQGSGGGKSLIFSSHADTVFEGTEKWTHPPFEGVIEDGKLYGRGAYDMKGGLAASMMAVKCVRELGLPIAGNVFVESVIDEEHGGANGTLAGRLRGPAADMAIIPEPTNLALYSAHLGGGIWKATFEGRSGIAFAGEVLISALDASIAFAHMLKEFDAYRRHTIKAPAPWDASRMPEVSVTKIISGDTHREIMEKLPASGEVQFWIDSFPGVTGEQVMESFMQFYDAHVYKYPDLLKCPPKITPLIRFLSASRMDERGLGGAFIRTVQDAGERMTGSQGEPIGAPFACDGFMFNLYSPTPALVLGPAGANAHAADEYLDLDSYAALIGWYAEIIASWCGAPDEA